MFRFLMFPRAFSLFSLLAALLVLNGCQLDRVSLGPADGRFETNPLLACPGDTVTLRWDLLRSRHPAFCRFANGNTPGVQRCASSTACGDGHCLDGECNRCALIGNERLRLSECAQPSSAGCMPTMNARIEISPEPDPALTNASDIWAEHSGERSFVIQQTSAIEFFSEIIDVDGARADVAGALGRFDAASTVTVVDPELRRSIPNNYECRGTPSWPGTLLETLFRGASPSLRLLEVHNPNRFSVIASGFDIAPLTLAPDERRSLNLPLSGLLSARPDDATIRLLPPVICTPTHTEGSYPSAPLNLTVGCPSSPTATRP